MKMGRGTKHILYGLLFLLTIGLVATTVYFLSFRVKPNCEDGILNQEEEEVDCGGPCISCEIKNFELIKSEVEVIPVGEAKITLVATIKNTNSNYGATGVNYSLDIENLIGSRLNLIEDETVIPPGATRYIVESGLSINPSDVGRIKFEIGEGFKLVPEKELIQHEVIIKQVKPLLSDGVVRTEGIATNNTGKDITLLKLSVLVRDNQGKLISAATTAIDRLSAFKGRGFTVLTPVPLDSSLEELKTEIFWEAF
jgi:hypothetical protein